MYCDAAARGLINNKFEWSGGYTQHLDVASGQWNAYPRPLQIAAPLSYQPLARLMPDAHLQRQHGHMARDLMLHANHYSHVMDAAVELLDVAAGESGDKQQALFGLCARFFNVAAHAEVRCHQLYHLNLSDRDEAAKAQTFIGK